MLPGIVVLASCSGACADPPVTARETRKLRRSSLSRSSAIRHATLEGSRQLAEDEQIDPIVSYRARFRRDRLRSMARLVEEVRRENARHQAERGQEVKEWMSREQRR